VIFTNQLRQKIGIMFGNPETTTGGNALKFYASIRMDIRRKDVLKEGGNIIGNRVRIKVVKNKMAPPFKETEFDILYNEGISKIGDLLDVGVEAGVIQKSGSWFSYGDERLGQGREGVRKFLKETPDLLAKIEAHVKSELGIGEPIAGAADTAPETPDVEMEGAEEESTGRGKKK
jgi:recombination protein RecA